MGSGSIVTHPDRITAVDALSDTAGVAMAIMSVCFVLSVLAQAALISSSPPPSGWRIHSKPKEEDLRCASFSTRRWAVSRSAESVEIRSLPEQRVAEPVPFDIDLARLGIWPKAQHVVLKLDSGWLVGFHGGEFGGGLWWFSSDGTIKSRLSEDNVRGLATVRGRMFAALGYAHGARDSGTVVEIADQGGAWQVRQLARLPASPQALVAEPQGSILVLTTFGLVRVDGDSTERLTAEGYPGLYPSSMVRLDDGTLYIGMRHFVVRLEPAHTTYREEWLLPASCQQFQVAGLDCVCESTKAPKESP